MSDNEDDDPFEEFEKSIGEREGDPFDDIGDGPETDDGNRDGSRAGPGPIPVRHESQCAQDRNPHPQPSLSSKARMSTSKR